MTICAHTNVLLHLLLFSASCKPKQLPWGIFFQSQVFNEEVAWTLQEFLVMAKQDFHLKDGPLSSHRLCKGERMENLQKEKSHPPAACQHPGIVKDFQRSNSPHLACAATACNPRAPCGQQAWGWGSFSKKTVGKSGGTGKVFTGCVLRITTDLWGLKSLCGSWN